MHRGNAQEAPLAGGSASWTARKLGESRGGALATANASTGSGGPTSGIELTTDAAPQAFAEWISDPLSADFTISGIVTGNLWMAESNMAANICGQFVVQKIDGATGALTTILNRETGAELPVTTRAAQTNGLTATSTACKRGDRIRVRVAINDATALTMGSGHSGTFGFNGNTAAADGDSYIRFTENLTFETLSASGSTYYLRDTNESINPGSATEKVASTTRGSASTTAVTNTADGPTAGVQITASAGGSTLEWYTPGLNAFTLGGVAKFNIRALESNAAANASLLAEIAVCASDGTGATVWGLANVEAETGAGGAIGELATTDGAKVAWVSGDDVSVTTGQRLRFRIFVDDCPNAALASTHTVTVSYDGGSAAAAGDTYVILPQTVTEGGGVTYPPDTSTVGNYAVTRSFTW